MNSRDLLSEDQEYVDFFRKRNEKRLEEINSDSPGMLTMGRAHELLYPKAVHSAWGDFQSDNLGFFLPGRARLTHYMMRQVFGVMSDPIELLATYMMIPQRKTNLFLGMLTAFRGGGGNIRALVYCEEKDYDLLKYVMIVLSYRFKSVRFEVRSTRPDRLTFSLNDADLQFLTVSKVEGVYDVLLDTIRSYSDSEISLLPQYFSAFYVSGKMSGKCGVPFCDPKRPICFSSILTLPPITPGKCQCSVCLAIAYSVIDVEECKVVRSICTMFGELGHCDGDTFSGEDPLSAIFFFLEDSSLSLKAKLVLHSVKDFFLYKSYTGDTIIGCMIEDSWYSYLVAQATLKDIGKITEVVVTQEPIELKEEEGAKALVQLAEKQEAVTPFFRKFIAPRIHMLSIKREHGHLLLVGKKSLSHLVKTAPKSDKLTEFMHLLIFLEEEARFIAFDRGPSFFCDVLCDCGRKLYYYKRRRLKYCNLCRFLRNELIVSLKASQMEADYRLDCRDYALRQIPFRKMRRKDFPRCIVCGYLFDALDLEFSMCSKCIESRSLIYSSVIVPSSQSVRVICTVCKEQYSLDFYSSAQAKKGKAAKCVFCSKSKARRRRFYRYDMEGKAYPDGYIPPPVPLVFSGDIEENPGPDLFVSASVLLLEDAVQLLQFNSEVERLLELRYGMTSGKAQLIVTFFIERGLVESREYLHRAANCLRDYNNFMSLYRSSL